MQNTNSPARSKSRLVACFLAAAMAAYYLAWKYVVGFTNQVLGIA